MGDYAKPTGRRIAWAKRETDQMTSSAVIVTTEAARDNGKSAVKSVNKSASRSEKSAARNVNKSVNRSGRNVDKSVNRNAGRRVEKGLASIEPTLPVTDHLAHK